MGYIILLRTGPCSDLLGPGKLWEGAPFLRPARFARECRLPTARGAGGPAPENFEELRWSRRNFSNKEYWDWFEIEGSKRWKIIGRGPGAEARKILSNLGGLETISAIRNIEIDDWCEIKGWKGGKLSAEVQGVSPGKFWAISPV
jgi:hypothetical protein